MRVILFIPVLCLGLLGCATQKDRQNDSAASESRSQRRASAKEGATGRNAIPVSSLSVTNGNQVITLTDPMVGKVAAVNSGLRFVVLDFSLNPVPPFDQRLSIYRQGNKVGEVRVTGPERNGNIVADMIRGEAMAGDEVRRE